MRLCDFGDVVEKNKKENEMKNKRKTLIKSNCSIDCRRTLKCLELEFELRVCDTSSDSVVERTSVSESVSIGTSGKPSILRKSDTFIRAVDSPTESPSYKAIVILVTISMLSSQNNTSLASP